MSDRVALYGTLRPGAWDDPDVIGLPLGLAPMLRWQGYCQIRGQLVDLGAYPGLVDGDGLVVAELFGIADDRALAIMDEHECFVEGRPRGSLFVRRAVMLAMPPVAAWVYAYNRDPAGLPVVLGGDWLRRA